MARCTWSGDEPASRAEGVEVSAGRRQRRHHDRACHHRCGKRQGDSPEDAARTSTARRSATTSAAAAERVGRCAVESTTASTSRLSPPHAITSRSGCALPTRRLAMFATVYDETRSDTSYESGNGKVNWKYLPKTNEFLWFQRARQLGSDVSVRSDHRQAEEPDHAWRRAMSRRCCMWTRQNRVRSTSWQSEKKRDRDPYFPHYYSINFDGTGRSC